MLALTVHDLHRNGDFAELAFTELKYSEMIDYHTPFAPPGWIPAVWTDDSSRKWLIHVAPLVLL